MRAFILAAGKGTRLGPLTQSTPKCLIPVGGRPMLAHVAEALRAAGVTEAIMNVHHLADQVEKAVEASRGFGLQISFSRENTLLGTGGGLAKVREFFSGSENFLVVNADIYTDYPLKQLAEVHSREAAVATLLTGVREESSYLLFDSEHRLSGYEIVGMRKELLDPKRPGTRAAFCGVQLLSPKIFDAFEGFSGEFSLVDVYLRAATLGQRVIQSPLGSHYWIDMGTPNKLKELEAHFELRA